MILHLQDNPDWLNEKKAAIEEAIAKHFKKLLKKSKIEISFVDKEKIKQLNKKYLLLEHYTDVLSFPLVLSDSPTVQKDSLLGEVYVCEEIVQLNAKEHNVDIKEEMVRVIVHGVLHILGFEHQGSLDEQVDGDKEIYDIQEALLEEILGK